MPSRTLVLIAMAFFSTARGGPVAAQLHHHGLDGHAAVHHGGFSWTHYDPIDAISSRIHAQADMIRAQGHAALDYAAAQKLHTEAVNKRLDNWMKAVRTHWEIKEVRGMGRFNEEHRQQIRKMKYLNDRKWQNSRVWDTLRNHPRLAASKIAKGEALNFLLEHLSVSALSYDYETSATRFSPGVLQALKLDPSWFAELNLKQGPLVFGAMDSVRDRIDRWPFLLQGREFELGRETFEQARKKVLEESKQSGQASAESIEAMQQALYELTQDFYASEKVKKWVKQYRRYTQFDKTERFLRLLDREVARVQETGDLRPLRQAKGYDPKEVGENLVRFLCFMNVNGIEFAPATPGKEEAYHHMFVMMRSLYLTVAEFDESIRPKDLRELAK